MASTAAGTTLSRTHRTAQIAIRAGLLRDLSTLWALFDLAAPDSYERFAELAGVLIRTRYADSIGIASAYYRAFLAAEGIGTRVIPLPAPPLDEARIRSSLYATGFAGTDRALRAGFAVDAAKRQGFVLVSGSATRLALEGGRETIVGTARADGLVRGWQRVTSGRPCAFCAMLAGRGPIYKESAAGFDAHDHCSCAAEPFYDGAAWPARNEQFRDLWNETTAGVSGADARSAFRAALEGRA